MYNYFKVLLLLFGILVPFQSFAGNDVDSSHAVMTGVDKTIIRLNSATAEQLITLKGVGLKKARAIIAYREAYGEFKSLEELLQVKGIGEAILSANHAKISL